MIHGNLWYVIIIKMSFNKGIFFVCMGNVCISFVCERMCVCVCEPALECGMCVQKWGREGGREGEKKEP